MEGGKGGVHPTPPPSARPRVKIIADLYINLGMYYSSRIRRRKATSYFRTKHNLTLKKNGDNCALKHFLINRFCLS